MKREVLIVLLVTILCVVTGCGKTKDGVVNKKVTLESMKNEDTSYLDVNDVVLAFPFTLNDFINAFPDYEVYAFYENGTQKIDVNYKLPRGTFKEIKVIKKLGGEDEKTKLGRTRFYLKSVILSDDDNTFGNTTIVGASYQYVDNYNFGSVKINGIEPNKTPIGVVKEFFKTTYGDYRVTDYGAIECNSSLTSNKFKKIIVNGNDAYPIIYVSVGGYSDDYPDTEIINYVSLQYGTI